MATPGPESPGKQQEIVGEFQQRRQRLMDIMHKVEELSAEVSEHDMVIRTLEPLDPDRKCFRLVGDVLVERTVKETLPAVKRNKENLEKTIKTLADSYQDLEKQLVDFQTKHKIRFVNQSGQPIDGPGGSGALSSAGGPAAGASSKGLQGVLVGDK